MIRNLKTLGLALVAVFALSAVVASAASAQNGSGTLTSDGPFTLIGTQTGEANANALVGFGLETTCANATLTGHKTLTTKQTEEGKQHQDLVGGESAVTITAHYGVCATSGFPTTVDMNGCDYDLELGPTVGTDKYSVNSRVVCPTGKHITLTVFGSAAKHTENKPFCHVTITENATGYAGLTATDTTNGHIDVSGEITGIAADKKSPNGSILCLEESGNTTLKQDVAVEGKNELGETTKISITHT